MNNQQETKVAFYTTTLLRSPITIRRSAYPATEGCRLPKVGIPPLCLVVSLKKEKKKKKKKKGVAALRSWGGGVEGEIKSPVGYQ